jgi:hypothetical protein
MKLLFLLVALQAPSGTGPGDPRRARAVVDSAVAAVDGDVVDAVRARWRERAASGDAYARLGLATLLRETYRYADADRQYGAILASGRDSANAALAANAWLGVGQGKLIRWRTDSAVHAFERVLELAPEVGDGLVVAQARLGLAAIASRTLSADTAAALADAAGRAIGASSTNLDNAQVRCAHAAVIRGGVVVRADSLVRTGLRQARAAGNDRAIGRCLLVLAQVYEIRGLQADSRHAVDSALIALRSTRDMLGLAAALQFSAYASTTYSIDPASTWRGCSAGSRSNRRRSRSCGC